MAASIASVSKVAPFTWRVAWSGTSPFYVVRNGRLVFVPTTTKTEHIFDHDDNEEPPVVEVYDSTEAETASAQMVNPPYLLMQWYHAENAKYYIAQQRETVGSNYQWITRKPTMFATGVGYYQFSTPVLDDETEHAWRIMALDDIGNSSQVEFTTTMVRNPDPPIISLAYSAATGNVTVSARST